MVNSVRGVSLGQQHGRDPIHPTRVLRREEIPFTEQRRVGWGWNGLHFHSTARGVHTVEWSWCFGERETASSGVLGSTWYCFLIADTRCLRTVHRITVRLGPEAAAQIFPNQSKFGFEINPKRTIIQGLQLGVRESKPAPRPHQPLRVREDAPVRHTIRALLDGESDAISLSLRIFIRRTFFVNTKSEWNAFQASLGGGPTCSFSCLGFTHCKGTIPSELVKNDHPCQFYPYLTIRCKGRFQPTTPHCGGHFQAS